MPPRQRKYPLEEFGRRGQEMYQTQIHPLVEAGNRGKFVAIDIDTGAFEMDEDERKASNRLFARLPDAQIFSVRIGYAASVYFSYSPPEDHP